MTAQAFPPLDAATECALRESIVRFGVLVPVVVSAGPWAPGETIDGHNRRRLATDLGVPFEIREVQVADEAEATELARTLNLDRRHLNREQRQEVAKALKAAGHSNRAIAGAMGTSEPTVRRDLAATASHDALEVVPDDMAAQDGEQGRTTSLPPIYPPGDKADVLRVVAESGADGATGKEIAAALGISESRSQRARKAVEADGWIVDAGLTRRTTGAGPAPVAWQISTEAAFRLGLDRGWSTKKKRNKKRVPPKTETPEERRAREEREAIRAVDDLELPGPKFRRHLGRLREWVTWFSDLADLAEEEHCGEVEQRALLVLLENTTSSLGRAQKALRRNHPKDMRFYTLLGVPHDANLETIQQAYRRLARRHHPDVNNGDTSRSFVEITEAYNTLREPVRRYEYDSNGRP